jgi:hypothetical protein
MKCFSDMLENIVRTERNDYFSPLLVEKKQSFTGKVIAGDT